jgi:hypothetical protein
MCPSTLIPILGFFCIGVGAFGLLSSLYPRCEYPERRLVVPIVKTCIWSGAGFFLLALGGMIPFLGTGSKCRISIPCPMCWVLGLALLYVLKIILTPHYLRWRLSSWASHNGFVLLDFGKLHGSSGERPCFRVALQDASGKERKAEVTLGSNAGFNQNHVNLVWLD